MEPSLEDGPPYAFLSYSSADRERALAIADVLERHGIAVWIDKRGIVGGTSWSQEIVRAIEASAVLLVLCSQTSMASRNVQQEVQLAWESDRPILPLMLEPTPIPEQIRYAVAGRQWLELFGRSERAWVLDTLQALARLNLNPGPEPADTRQRPAQADARRCPSCDAPTREDDRFCANCGSALPAPTGEPSQSSHSISERRNITVLAVEFLPVSDRDASPDPEDFAHVAHEARLTASQIVSMFGGTPADTAVQGLTAYFGYPVIHEDAAIRATRAALDIVSALDRTLRGRVQTSAAIHTGLALAEAIETPGSVKVWGDISTIASGLLAQCEPGTVVASAATHRLIDGYFRTTDLGPQRMRGHGQPRHMFLVLEESETRTRLDVAARRGLAPLVGRQPERGLLHERWERAREGDGQVVLLVGEAGIGKSRLSRDFREAIAIDPTVWIAVLQSSAIHQQSPFYPVTDMLERGVFGFTPNEPVEAKRARIDEYLVEHGMARGDASFLLASLLGLPPGADAPTPPMAPDRQRQRTLEALLALIESRAERQPVLLVCEDLHWTDPSTLELLTLLVDDCPSLPLMIVITSRPGIEATWFSRAHVTTVNLPRLSTQQAGHLVDGVLGGRALPSDVREQVIGRADGVPLFVEELTRSVTESGEMHEVDGRYELAGNRSAIGIPATLADLLHARLDRLGDAREVAQLGATIGREFPLELLTAAAPWGESWLRQSLARLVDADLIQQRRFQSQTTYTFRHALTQEAAYGSMARERRQEAHRRIAEAMVEQFPETFGSRHEVVAHHFTEAGDVSRAIPCWLEAGRRALHSFANAEAIAHLQRGLALLAATPDSVDRMQAELGLQITLGLALMTTRGFAAPEVQAAYQRAHELCQAFGDVPQLFPAVNGLWTYYVVRAELETARQLSEQQLRLADQADENDLRLEANLNRGTTAFFMGDLERARTHLERARGLYDPVRHREHAYLYGHEPGSATLSYLSLTLCLLGYPDQAIERSEDGIRLGSGINHPLSLARNLCEAAVLRQLRNEPEAAQTQAQRGLAYCTEHGIVLWGALASAYLGWAISITGDPTTGLDLLRQSIAGYEATGALLGVSHLLTCLAEALERAGATDDALPVIERALAHAESSGEQFYRAESLRVLARLQHHRGHAHRAEAALNDALAVARDQRSMLFELRVATNLADVVRTRAGESEAREILEPLLDGLTEGFDLSDYVAAREALDQPAP